MKALLFFGALILGAFYFFGGSGGAYSREVDRPPATVAAALVDLDITAQPGAPGTDPSRSGGIRPSFQFERGPDRLTWTVMSGDRVATRMIALLEPLDGGKRTRVTAQVERGDAPDDFVSPAFRSQGVTMGLFGMALESELDQFVVGSGWSSKCDEMVERFKDANLADPEMRTPRSEKEGFGYAAKAILKMNALDGELKAHGCNPDVEGRKHGFDGNHEFGDVTETMSSAKDRPSSNSAGVSFEAGKPMMDTTQSENR